MVINPNRQVEEMFRRPKSRFMRRLVARYVIYVEVAGFVFIFAMIAALIWFTFHKDEVTLEFKDSGKLKMEPSVSHVNAPAAGAVTQMLATPGQEVREGHPLLVFHYAGRDAVDTLRASQAGIVFAPKGRELDAGPLGAVDSGAALVEVVDFSRLSVAVQVENKDDLMRIRRGSKVYLKPDFKDPRRVMLETGGRGADGMVRALALKDGDRQRFEELLLGEAATGRDKSTQYSAFTIHKVEELEIEVEAAAAPVEAIGPGHLVADSLLGSRLQGTVRDGRFILELEMAQIPAKAREAMAEAVSALERREVAARSGNYQLGAIGDVRVQAKVHASLPISAGPIAKAKPEGLPNSSVSKRKFEGVVVVDAVPSHIQRSARLAYASGTRLTTRAEVVVAEQSLAKRLFSRK